MDDWELLRAYAEGSEGAFADLLRRHVDPVYSAALRRIHDPQLAQDISQRVFCLLARKASSLPRTGSLIGWLHRTTCHLALETLRSNRRRRDREAEAARLNVVPTESATDNAWQQVAPQLDEALLELPETDRLALLLRFFQKLPLRDVGERLGVSEAAAKMRVGRAVLKLRQGLGARGVTLTAGALVWLLADKSAVAAPAGCVSGVTTAVASIGSGVAVSPIAALVAGLNQLTAPMAIVAGLLLLATLGTLVLPRSRSNPGTESTDPGAFSELSESNVLALDATGPDASTTGDSDLIDDPRQVELAIAHLQNTLREPFSRRVPRDRLRDALLPLGRHSRLAVPIVMSELRDPAHDLPVTVGSSTDMAPVQQRMLDDVTRRSAVFGLAALGAGARESLPILQELAKRTTDSHLRDEALRVIHDIDPNAPVSVFTGESVIPASNALIQARNDAEQAGNVDRARLAESTAQRIEINHGMTRKELLKIAADLQAADPDLQAIYVQALREANPSLRDSLAMRP